MKARRGALRVLCLGVVATGLVAGAGAPDAEAVQPARAIGAWIPLEKGGVVATDPTNDFTPAHLNLTPAGASGPAAFFSADLVSAYFRVHVAAGPAADATGAYVIQFDTDDDTSGWEAAVRYDPVARTATLFSTAANSDVKAAGTAGVVVPPSQTAGVVTDGDGGAYVAFAVPRGRLAAAGVTLGGPMVIGATNQSGAGLDPGTLLAAAKADVLGIGKNSSLSTPAWGTLDTDPFDLDSDGDGIADKDDNCPITANPGQEDDDKVLEDAYPPNHALDGTEGDGNVCDATPRGQDLIDRDGVGALDDKCGEQYGLLANGCPAQSTTTAVLRYSAKRTKFTGVVRADYDQCVPRRSVTVLKSVAGPDKRMGTVRTRANGSYLLDKRARKGTYYASVDPKWTLGARCFGKKSPKIQVR